MSSVVERKRGLGFNRFFGFLLFAGSIVSSASADEPHPALGSIVWKNGERLPGEIIEGTASRLLWRSPHFEEPFLFDLRLISHIDFLPAREVKADEQCLRFGMTNGDLLRGSLVAMTETDLTFSSRRFGAVQVPRSRVQGFHRLASATNPTFRPIRAPTNLSRVSLIDGEILDGRVGAFDRDKNTFLVTDPLGARRLVPLEKLAKVVFAAADTTEAERESEVLLTFYDGERISGSVVGLEPDKIKLKTPHLLEPVAISLVGAEELGFHNPSEVSGSDTIELHGLRMHGRVEAVAGKDGGFTWRPSGSANASRLIPGTRARFTRSIDGTSKPSLSHRDVLHTCNGDSLRCTVLSMNAASISVVTPSGEHLAVPAKFVAALGFDTMKGAIVDQSDEGWRISQSEQSKVEIDGDKILVKDDAIFGYQIRPDAPRIVEFDLAWRSMAGVQVIAVDKRGSPLPTQNSRAVVFQENVVRAPSGPNDLRVLQLKDQRALCRIKASADQYELFVNEQLVWSGSVVDRSAYGLQVMFIARANWGRGAANPGELPARPLLRIDNFRVFGASAVWGDVRIDNAVRDVVLTVPRERKSNPPTHLLIGKNGDVLRGRLIEVNADEVRFESRLEETSIARNRVAGIVRLQAATDPKEPVVEQAGDLRAVMQTGETVVLKHEGIEGRAIVGTSSVFGRRSILFDEIRLLELGPVPLLSADALTMWTMHPAKEPRFSDPTGAVSGLDSPLVGTAPTGVVMKLLSGEEFRLQDHEPKIVVLDFWATWCGPCVRSMPEVIEAVGQFPPDRVALVAVNQEEQAKTIADFLSTRELKVTVGLDPDGAVSRLFHADFIPQTVLLKGGKVERVYVGAHPNLKETVAGAIRELLAQ